MKNGGDNMKTISRDFICELAKDTFDELLEDIDMYMNYSYDDMTSEQQKQFIEILKIELDKLCDDELNNIEQNWTDDSLEVKQLKNRIKELESQVESMYHGNCSEDMGS